MTVKVTSTVNADRLPINVKIGLNSLIQVEAQGEPGDSLQTVMEAAIAELGLKASDYIGDAAVLRETVTVVGGGQSRRAETAEEPVAAGETVIVNQANKNG